MAASAIDGPAFQPEVGSRLAGERLVPGEHLLLESEDLPGCVRQARRHYGVRRVRGALAGKPRGAGSTCWERLAGSLRSFAWSSGPVRVTPAKMPAWVKRASSASSGETPSPGYLQPGSLTVCPGGWHLAPASFGPLLLCPGRSPGQQRPWTLRLGAPLAPALSDLLVRAHPRIPPGRAERALGPHDPLRSVGHLARRRAACQRSTCVRGLPGSSLERGPRRPRFEPGPVGCSKVGAVARALVVEHATPRGAGASARSTAPSSASSSGCSTTAQWVGYIRRRPP
jgi:hypothetical protein